MSRAGLGPAAVVAAGAALADEVGFAGLTMGALAQRIAALTHPGRHAATIGVEPSGPHDPVAVAGARLTGSFEAVLRAYAIAPHDTVDALRALRSAFHGFATLQSANGFQQSADVDGSLEWLIALVDRGLRRTPCPEHPHAVAPTAPTASTASTAKSS